VLQHEYLVTGSEGPGYATPEQAIEVLEKGILPTFDTLMNLEADKKILAGGLPVGDRCLGIYPGGGFPRGGGQLLRDLPAWGVLKWAVIPLQSFEGRAKKERSVVEGFKKQP
jgi:hypothetical protein